MRLCSDSGPGVLSFSKHPSFAPAAHLPLGNPLYLGAEVGMVGPGLKDKAQSW